MARPIKKQRIDGEAAWGCPHNARGRCELRSSSCEPGAKGCVLEGRMEKRTPKKAAPEPTPGPRSAPPASPGSAAARRLTVKRGEAGLRLDLFLVAAMEKMSRKQAKRLIDGRAVSVNAKIEPMASRPLREGDEVTVRVPPEAAAPPRPAAPPELYRDEWIVAVDKGPFLPSGPTRDKKRPHAERLASEAAGESLILLHRLDRDTTGVLLLARTGEAASAMEAAFRTRTVKKRYLALVRGRTPATFGDVCHLREAEGSRVEVVKSGGMRAETEFKTLALSPTHSLVEARPVTGRMHQLRVQLARLGHPIVGDALYGGEPSVRAGGGTGEEVAAPRQMLHAWRVAFDHPGEGRPMEIEAPPPEDFVRVAEALFGRGKRPWRSG